MFVVQKKKKEEGLCLGICGATANAGYPRTEGRISQESFFVLAPQISHHSNDWYSRQRSDGSDMPVTTKLSQHSSQYPDGTETAMIKTKGFGKTTKPAEYIIQKAL